MTTPIITDVVTGVFSILTSICLTSAASPYEMTETEDEAGCTRELWSVLYGVGATFVALLVCVHPWEYCVVHDCSSIEEHGSIASRPAALSSIGILLKLLSPQICFVPRVLSAVHATKLLQDRLTNLEPGRTWMTGFIAKRLCPMVVWIGIDEETYQSSFGSGSSTSVQQAAASRPPAGDDDTGSLTELERRTVKAFFDVEHPLEKEPDLKVAVPWPGSRPPCAAGGEGDEQVQKTYYFCLQGWDKRACMWKEAMVVTEALGTDQNIVKWMEMMKVTPWWARALMIVLGLGYEASVVSRFKQQLGVSPLEVMCSWILLVVMLDATIVPLLVVPSHQGIHLFVDRHQFCRVVRYYVHNRHMHPHALNNRHMRPHVLTSSNFWSFVLGILTMFSLSLGLIPPLVYYYYKIPKAMLSFCSIILFAVLTGAGISFFTVMLFAPAHQESLSFSHSLILCRPSFIFGISLGVLLTTLASYILAITDTAMNWPLFEARDRSFISSLFPHIG